MGYEEYQKRREDTLHLFVTSKSINENVISFINVLPKEFDLRRFVDYDMQFEKSFVDPLKVIITKLNWNVEPVASLNDFFG